MLTINKALTGSRLKRDSKGFTTFFSRRLELESLFRM